MANKVHGIIGCLRLPLWCRSGSVTISQDGPYVAVSSNIPSVIIHVK